MNIDLSKAQKRGWEIKHINLEKNIKCIPFQNVAQAINYMKANKKNPYIWHCYVMFWTLYETGARISELDNMLDSMLFGRKLIWFRGKNQLGQREEIISEELYREIKEYRANNKVNNNLFCISHTTFGRYFDRDVRPHLTKDWNEYKLRFRKELIKDQYMLQIKGLRKTWAALNYYKQNKRWNSWEVAKEFTCKDMGHSSSRITIVHYLENFKELNLERFGHLTPFEIVKMQENDCLLSFL